MVRAIHVDFTKGGLYYLSYNSADGDRSTIGRSKKRIDRVDTVRYIPDGCRMNYAFILDHFRLAMTPCVF